MESDVRSGTANASITRAVRGVVPRRALFGRPRIAGRVTEVSAPPGSGKTVLLRSWIADLGLAKSASYSSISTAVGGRR